MIGGGLAAVALGVPAPAQQQSVQQAFEAATALMVKGENEAALRAWEALEKRVEGSPRNLAIVRVRKSEVLFNLDRKQEVVVAARAGLAGLPESDKTLDEDRFLAWNRLGQIAEASLDYAGAADAYRHAVALAPSPLLKIKTLRGLIATDTFVDPARVGEELAQADALLASMEVDPGAKAIFDQLRSEWLLNQGDFKGAREAADDAVDGLGGLTSKTDLYDVAARSDYALAAVLAGDDDAARRYMAMTGAGRLPKGNFGRGVQMKVPDCGGEDGLRPEDVAIVQFSIGDDGAVLNSVPVYSSAGGEAALAFARAARQWSWTPEQVKNMPQFFRYRARVELRCSTAFERPSVGDYLDGALGEWLTAKGVALPSIATGSDAAVLPEQRARLTAAEASGGDTLALVPLLSAVVRNSVVPREEVNKLAERGVAILREHDAPPTALLAMQRFAWESATPEGWSARDYDRAVSPGLAQPVYAANAEARSAIRLMLADRIRRKDEDRARLLLRQVADDTALAANHPLKVGALVRLASLEAGEGNVAAAQAAFERSGLDARQCALVDSPPKLRSANSSSRDFPREAQRWGFEGWTKVQFDIDADGHVLNERAIVSYPPFVFTKAGTNLISGARYEKSFRPDGGLGCGGQSNSIAFRLGRWR
jgi:tetratricopeptide (TPR) repeat protein